jgi:hypothetical protein
VFRLWLYTFIAFLASGPLGVAHAGPKIDWSDWAGMTIREAGPAKSFEEAKSQCAKLPDGPWHLPRNGMELNNIGMNSHIVPNSGHTTATEIPPVSPDDEHPTLLLWIDSKKLGSTLVMYQTGIYGDVVPVTRDFVDAGKSRMDSIFSTQDEKRHIEEAFKAIAGPIQVFCLKEKANADASTQREPQVNDRPSKDLPAAPTGGAQPDDKSSSGGGQ